jgi:ketosteroid isomerase-like protein
VEERLAMRFPKVVARATARLLRLGPRSPLRRAMLLQGVRLGFEATNRRDFDLLLARYHPDAATHHHPQTHELAYEPSLRGREGVLRFFEQWLAEWEEVRYEPVELLDPGGNRFMVLSEIVGTGRESGVPVREKFAQLFEIENGWIVRVDAWMGPWDEALEAVGLRE